MPTSQSQPNQIYTAAVRAINVTLATSYRFRNMVRVRVRVRVITRERSFSLQIQENKAIEVFALQPCIEQLQLE